MSSKNRQDETADNWLKYMQTRRFKWYLVLSISVFLVIFLLTFLPFGVSNHDPNFQINPVFIGYLAGLGMVVLAVLSVNTFLIQPRLFPELSPHTYAIWIAWLTLITGSVAYLYYNLLGGWHDLGWLSYLSFVLDVSLIVSFPIIGLHLFARYQGLKYHLIDLKPQSAPAEADELVKFIAENSKDVFVVERSNLRYLKAQDNYVEIYFLAENSLRSHLLRTTLKKIEHQEIPALMRCHRSYMVNTTQIQHCKGNRQGLTLQMKECEETIPVSRNYSEQILGVVYTT